MKENQDNPISLNQSLAKNKDTFLLTLLQLQKDLALSEETFQHWLTATSGAEILQHLNIYFSQPKFQKGTELQQIFYRLDIPEKKIRESKNLVAAEQIQFISQMALERAFQKVYFRIYFAKKEQKKGRKKN